MVDKDKTETSTRSNRIFSPLFNIFFFPVIGIGVFSILLSFLIYRTPADVLGTILDIFFNIWLWLFLVFIFIFRKTGKTWSLVLSILFGVAAILDALSLFITLFVVK